MELLQEIVAQIHHTCRQGYYYAMQKVTLDGLEKFSGEPTLMFYFSMSLLFQKKTSDALRQLNPLHNKPRVALGALLASIAGHRVCIEIDQEELASLEARVREERKTAKPEELYYAGVFLYFSGKPEKAKEYLDRAIKQSNQLYDAISLRGWVELNLTGKDKEKSKKLPLDYFELVLKSNRKHIDSNLGVAYYYELSRQFDGALEKLNGLLAYYPNWIPSLEEKMKLVLCIQDWDQALDLANRILSINPLNLEANRLKILYSLCREGDSNLVIKSLENFFILCKENEPSNPKYYIDNARMFSQLGSYNKDVLTQSLKFAKYGTELDLDCAEYVGDVGRILLLMQKYKEAYQEFRAATTMDNASMSALYGLISCQLAEGNIELASQQLEFLRELSATIDTPPELSYLAAVIAKKKNSPAEDILTYLNEAVDNHFREIKKYPYNIAYLKSINPDLVIKIVREYLLFAPQEPTPIGTQPPVSVRQATMILDTVLKVCPSHRDGLFINAQIKYLSGDLNTACFILNQILKIDPTLMDGYLLMTQIQINKDEFKEASQTLEYGLSSNFKVREHPKYHLLLAKIERNNKDNTKALQAIKDALNLVKNSRAMLGKSDDCETQFEFGSPEVLALYMEYVAILRTMKKFEEANRILEEAFLEFKGTHLDGRIALIQAEEFVNNGDIDKAIEFLLNIKPTQNHYVDSRKLLAEILLEYKHDKQLYTNCFIDIVNQNSTPANLVMLGDAYMSVQEHEKAIEVFEIALSKNPKDTALASKMGQAFVSTHNFQKAINYYKEGIKSEDNFSMRLDLATLHLKLKQWDKSEKTLQQALIDLKDTSLSGLMMEANILCLLGRVQQGAGNLHQAQQSLIKAKESQSRVLKRTILEQPSYLIKQKLQFAFICKQLGEIVEKPNDIEFAIKNLKEALNLCPGDTQLLATLSKLYLKVDDHINCQIFCEQLLQVKSDSVDANFMLGELYFRHYHDFSKSVIYFQQILENHPTYFSSLAWCIECMRRCGKLTDVESYIKKAIDRSDPDDPGLGYCVGLFEWYNGNPNSAIKSFNKARKDPVYGQKSIIQMIQIYLYPILNGDSSEIINSNNDSKLSNGSGIDSREIAINTADTLIGDLTAKNSEDKFKRQILECMILLATKNKNKMEKALQELSGLSITDQGRESIMLVYALAVGYSFLKHSQRARNQLKRIVRSTWTFEEAEYLEGCWILLSDTYIQSSKFDMATDIIRKVLTFNKGCSKAHEYLGYIMEKEQAYTDAAIDYEQAWKLSNCSSAELGYKLAYNYLKAKRYPDAIDVCHIVLAKQPNYPKIKKEILDKARASLRV